ncbi:hypothetical protein KUF83_28635 [Streptomyces sp. BV286]|uniref:hypothetical protein n=1 Tax=Streptomyces sp. BV286 TaxID=2849672 RepID=UPI001C2E25E2|nr:hypothetical protein [Streptomyces sp. BV286]MBV1940507.1 hypothetical protein [Streptomyces sp. BV286]
MLHLHFAAEDPSRARLAAESDPSTRPLLQLAPPRGYPPDFLTPSAGPEQPMQSPSWRP